MNINDRLHLSHDLYKALSGINYPLNAQEPDYIAQLVKDLPGIIKASLSALYPARQISVGGAFIHQKPIVHFVKRAGFKDPELGDLLLVCREKRSMGDVYNAMLLQAKVTDSPISTKILIDHQFILYSEWPEFQYKRAGSLNGKTRSILPKTITQGAQYLLINRLSPNVMLTASVDNPLNGSREFAFTIASILSFEEGRTFQVNNPRDDWSQMILDLLCTSAAATFNRRRSGHIAAKRWRGDMAFNFILNPEEPDKEVLGLLKYHDAQNEEAISGESVICIDLGESANSQNDQR